jgi:hypothetical protein
LSGAAIALSQQQTMSIRGTGHCLRTGSRHSLVPARCFSVALQRLSNRLPPDSPSYIRLPKPPQFEERKHARVRGSLPVPREIFPRIEGDRKLQPGYVQQTVPRPAKPSKVDTPERGWKTLMAASRRQNLEDGLKELWERRTETEYVRSARNQRKFKEHNTAAIAPEREDERLTRGTVMEPLLDTKVYIDPQRFARADRSRSRVMAAQNAKRESRRDALMELYISASNFITQESELKAEIENIFSEDYFKRQSQAAGRWGTENAWGIYGNPPSIANMLETTTGTSTKLVDVYESEYDRSVKRQKRIAEEFTGGKME